MPNINITSGDSTLNLYYEDIGAGKPVVLIHGWPLSSEMWEYQTNELPKHGIRCITYDRRGFGKSDKPWAGYDYDSLASDLNELLEKLDVKDATLVGFSMGGGEVARYISKYGTKRISKAVLVSSVTPMLMQTLANPEGVPKNQFDEIVGNLEQDRPTFLAAFGKQFFGEGLMTKPVTNDVLAWTSQLALRGAGRATIDCVRSFSETDFKEDLKTFNLPTLIIHGDADKTVPFDTTGKVAAKMIPGAKLSVFEGAPHGLFFTHKDRLNTELITFIKK